LNQLKSGRKVCKGRLNKEEDGENESTDEGEGEGEGELLV